MSGLVCDVEGFDVAIDSSPPSTRVFPRFEPRRPLQSSGLHAAVPDDKEDAVRIQIATAVIALTCSALPLAQSTASKASATEKQIEQMDRDYHAARLKNDVAAVNRFYAPDYYQVNSGGQAREVGNRDTGPVNTTPAGDKWEKFEIRNDRVRVYGDTAVSTYIRHVNARTKDGRARDFELLVSNVWVKRSARWMIVLSQATTVPERR